MSSPPSGKVFLVGAGPGDPGLITAKGIECLRRAQVVVYDRLVDPVLLKHVPRDAEIIYAGKAARDHALTQAEINLLLLRKAQEGKVVVRLKGGDPFVFGRGGEELELLAGARIPFEVVPGVTSAIAAPAYAGIPITHREFTSSFTVVTGHEDPTKPDSSIRWDKIATASGTLIFLMGVENLSLIVKQLVAHGRPPETPIALVRWGTRADQDTLDGTLGNIEERLKEHPLGPPAVIVVGEVVGLRERYRWFDSRPLFGRRVLVTRSRDQASRLSSMLAELGAQPIEAPAIEIHEPDDYAPLDAALDRLASCRWVVFTSANGVEAVFRRLRSRGADARAFAGVAVAAIGPATAASLESRGIVPDFVPDQYLSSSVAQGLAARGVAGARVLLPRTDLLGEDLAGALSREGAQVDQVIAYRTVQAQSLDTEVRDLLERGELDIITFASSSTVRHLAALAGDPAMLSRSLLASIGPVTSAAVCQVLGREPDIVAREHTVPGLVAAILEHFSPSETGNHGSHVSDR